jgi:hypothetical protein
VGAPVSPAPSSRREASTPPVPDTIPLELRAIRRELELIHQDQARILNEIDALKQRSAKGVNPAAKP